MQPTGGESIKIGFVPKFRVVFASAVSPLQALTASITPDEQGRRPFRDHMASLRKSETAAGLDLAETRKAEKNISDAFRTLIRAGYTIQPPKQPGSQGDGGEAAQKQRPPSWELEPQASNDEMAQEPAAAVGHATPVADSLEPVEVATRVELVDPSENQERKERLARTPSPHWERGRGPVASLPRARPPARPSFGQAVPQLHGPSPPLTPKDSPGLFWLEPEVRAQSPLQIPGTVKDERPSVSGPDDAHSRCCTYAYSGRESGGPRSAREDSSRRSVRAAARSPEDRGSRAARTDSFCSGCSEFSADRQDGEVKTDMLTIDIGLVSSLLTIIQDFVPSAHSYSGDVHSGGSLLLMSLLTTIRKHIPTGPSGLSPKSASLRLLSRLFGILQPYIPEDGARPRITIGAMRGLLGDLVAAIRGFCPDVDPDPAELLSADCGSRRRRRRRRDMSNDYGEPVEPPRHRPGRSRERRHVSGGWTRPSSPRGGSRCWSPKRGNSWRDGRAPPYPTDSLTLLGSRHRFVMGPQDYVESRGSLGDALPPHHIIRDSRHLGLYLGACDYVVVLGGRDQEATYSSPPPPSCSVVFVPAGEEWRVTTGLPHGGGTTERARPVVGAAELAACLGAALSTVVVGDLDLDQVLLPGRRYGAVVVPTGEEWRLGAWDGRPPPAYHAGPERRHHHHSHAVARDRWGSNGEGFGNLADAFEGGVGSEYWILGHGAPQKWEDTRQRPRCDGAGQCSVAGRCMALIVRGCLVSRPWGAC
ncbi:hypothetical protein RB596_000248 [Gaeumannomyces avenae]